MDKETRSPIRNHRDSLKIRSRIILLAASLFFVLVISAAGEADRLTGEDSETLYLGFTRNVFSDVHVPDALAAMKVWTGELKKNQGIRGDVETKVFEDIDQVSEAVVKEEIDVVILTTSEYLKIPAQSQVTPHFVHTRNNSVTEDSVLLVHRQSDIQNFSDLKGKQILVMNHARTSTAKIWLENKVLEQGYTKLNEFFGHVEEVDKSSKSILPVFFKQKAACLIHRGGFEMISELNPQIRRDLRILTASPATMPSVTCIRSDYDPELTDQVIDALSNLQNEPSGQQILVLFKIEKLVPFKETYLDSSREIIEENLRLIQGIGTQITKLR